MVASEYDPAPSGESSLGVDLPVPHRPIATHLVVRPNLVNLLMPPSEPVEASMAGSYSASSDYDLVPLTYPNPTDPTVITLGINSTTLPVSSGSTPTTRKPIRRPPVGTEGVLSSTDPFAMTRAHLAAYRVIQLRRPSPPVQTRAQDGTKRRRLCVAEAAWWYWAEKGGRWNGGKGGKKAKKDKAREQGGEVGIDPEVEDGGWGLNGRACNAYSYDENGDPYRPTMSMLEILRLVLAASMDKMLSLPDIYRAVEARWPYYKTCSDTWKGSIRNNLSVHECFQQVAREDEQGRPLKGWWKVEADITTSLYPRSKEKDRSRKLPSSQPLLSTDTSSHNHLLLGSTTTSQPSTSVPSPRKRRRTDEASNPPVQRDPSGRRYKYQLVNLPGKTLDFPLPGIAPHPAGVVPPGYPNPLPPGWKYGWGDPTLVDLGRRYGGEQREMFAGVSAGEKEDWRGQAFDIREEEVPQDGPAGERQFDQPSFGRSSGSQLPSRSTEGFNSAFAPLAEFSDFLNQPFPTPLNRSISYTSSSSSTATSTTRFSTWPLTKPPLHLPFLNLLNSHPLPSTSSSSLPFPDSGSTPISARLTSRAPDFVPLEARGKWRSRIRDMEPFPGSGEWVDVKRPFSRSWNGLPLDCEVRGGGDLLPSIDAILGPGVLTKDPRLAVMRTRGSERAAKG